MYCFSSAHAHSLEKATDTCGPCLSCTCRTFLSHLHTNSTQMANQPDAVTSRGQTIRDVQRTLVDKRTSTCLKLETFSVPRVLAQPPSRDRLRALRPSCGCRGRRQAAPPSCTSTRGLIDSLRQRPEETKYPQNTRRQYTDVKSTPKSTHRTDGVSVLMFNLLQHGQRILSRAK